MPLMSGGDAVVNRLVVGEIVSTDPIGRHLAADERPSALGSNFSVRAEGGKVWNRRSADLERIPPQRRLRAESGQIPVEDRTGRVDPKLTR